MQSYARFLPDPFAPALIGTVILAAVLPAQGQAAVIVGYLGIFAIGLLFFLNGARLPREAIRAGIAHWRLQLAILASTFALFPLFGWLLQHLMPGALTTEEWLGVMFVCTLPSTVQSSIAFTSIARGNVAAAICAATASNMAGIVLTPILVTLVLRVPGAEMSLAQAWKILLQLVAPFVLGNLLRPWIAGWAQQNRRLLAVTDRGSILLIVYAAFSESVVGGIWRNFPPATLAVLLVVNALLLAAVLAATAFGSRALGFVKQDEIAIVFCGSKKSLMAGIPMANVLFGATTAGVIVLPLIPDATHRLRDPGAPLFLAQGRTSSRPAGRRRLDPLSPAVFSTGYFARRARGCAD
jgi:solute carrier family 10 (sodium/bile acid cotransporter), member 7